MHMHVYVCMYACVYTCLPPFARESEPFFDHPGVRIYTYVCICIYMYTGVHLSHRCLRLLRCMFIFMHTSFTGPFSLKKRPLIFSNKKSSFFLKCVDALGPHSYIYCQTHTCTGLGTPRGVHQAQQQASPWLQRVAASTLQSPRGSKALNTLPHSRSPHISGNIGVCVYTQTPARRHARPHTRVHARTSHPHVPSH